MATIKIETLEVNGNTLPLAQQIGQRDHALYIVLPFTNWKVEVNPAPSIPPPLVQEPERGPVIFATTLQLSWTLDEFLNVLQLFRLVLSPSHPYTAEELDAKLPLFTALFERWSTDTRFAEDTKDLFVLFWTVWRLFIRFDDAVIRLRTQDGTPIWTAWHHGAFIWSKEEKERNTNINDAVLEITWTQSHKLSEEDEMILEYDGNPYEDKILAK